MSYAHLMHKFGDYFAKQLNLQKIFSAQGFCWYKNLNCFGEKWGNETPLSDSHKCCGFRKLSLYIPKILMFQKGLKLRAESVIFLTPCRDMTSDL